MATKLYTAREYHINWLTASLTLKGGWDAASSPYKAYFTPSKEEDTPAVRSSQTATTPPGRRALLLGVSPRLTAQTISGTVNPMVFFAEANAAYDCFLRLHLYVTVGDTNAVRGTLLTYEDTANEFAVSTLTAQRFSAAQTLTPVAAQDGDRIGIELGFIQNGPASTSYNVSGVIGTRYQTGDATVGSTAATGSTALNQYIEFSADLVFKPGLPNQTCAGATVVATFPFSATVDTTNSLVANAPNPSASCSNWGDDTLPVWWQLTPAASQTLSIHTGGSAYPTIVSLWTGACGAQTEVACAVSPTAAAPLVFTPTTGAVYYLLVQRDVGTAGSGPGGSLSVAVAASAGAAPGCTTAIPITTIPTTITALDTTALGYDSVPALTCCSVQRHMQWFRYTPTTSHRLYLRAAGTNYDHSVAVFTGACPAGPWTQLACRFGTSASAAEISTPVTAGTTYWIVVAADGNPGGLLTLLFGDTAALGFIHAGEPGAVEWEGNYNYFDCFGAPCCLQVLQTGTGAMIIALRIVQQGACSQGDPPVSLMDIERLDVLANGTLLPAIPLTAFSPPAPCAAIGMEVQYGHINQPSHLGGLRFRFRLSSWDTVSGATLPDGYIEVTWPGSTFGTYRWDNLTLQGRTWDGFGFHPGFWTDRVYLRKLDAYSGWDAHASALAWYRDFTAIPGTEAELFAESGGLFDRYSQFECGSLSSPGALPNPPRLDGSGRPTFLTTGGTPSCFTLLRRVTAFPPYAPTPGVPLTPLATPALTWTIPPGLALVATGVPPDPSGGGWPPDDVIDGGSCPVPPLP